jgi:tripartite-type tricarboxylate transporter receptor subunit TctC
VGAIYALPFIPFAQAESYPSRPITVVVPFPAGGPSDATARILADRIQDKLGQPLVVENVGGAAGSIGTGRVARAASDAHTLVLGYWGTHVANAALYKLTYDVQADFEPVAPLPSQPQILVSKKALPVDDLKGLIVWLKANPEKATQGTAGVGSAGHLVGLQLQKATGTRYAFVPYRGVAPVMQDVTAGQIDFAFGAAAASVPLWRSGLIKAFAVTAKSRLQIAPEIPTVDEADLPGLYFTLWQGPWAPKGTPKAVIITLNEAVAAALADPVIRQKFSDQGFDIPPPKDWTPEALASLQKSEI